MSATTMVETFDTPMVDFNEDSDIPMAGSSGETWLHPMSRMDEDGLVDQDSYSQVESLEVDMITYEETAEYEMGDEASVMDPVDHTLLDADVQDISLYPSPIPSHSSDLAEKLDAHGTPAVTENLVHPQHITEGAHPTPLQIHDVTRLSALPPLEFDSTDAPSGITVVHSAETFDAQGDSDSKQLQRLVENEATPAITIHARSGDADKSSTAHPSSTLLEPHHVELDNDGAGPSAAHAQGYTQSDTVVESQPNAEQTTLSLNEHVETVVEHSEDAPQQPHLDEQDIHDEVGSTGQSGEVPVYTQTGHHESTEQVHHDAPPSIHLTLHTTSTEGNQPEFVLFSLPEASQIATELSSVDVQATEDPLVLLQHQPSLFYEPISAVLEAFRREEYFSHLDELSNAEMALNAYDLQLLISEDNIYAREVSLHDLVAMHQGVGLPGHLRLMLQSVVPRFISRYNLLRDQITRMSITGGTEERQETNEEADEAHQDGHDAQANEEAIIPQDVEKEGEAQPHVDQVEDSDETHNELTAEEIDATEEDLDEDAEGEPDDDVGELDVEDILHQAGGVVEQNELEQEDQAPYEDEFGRDNDDSEAGERLDADEVHALSDEAKEEGAEEHATEYVDVTDLPEDDDDGAGDDFGDNGADGTGTVADAEESVIPEAEGYQEGEDHEQSSTAPAVRAQTLSNSTSTSSHETETTSRNDEGEDADPPVSKKEQTDHSSEKLTEIHHEEGNIGAGIDDEFGDEEFPEDEFWDEGASTEEGTLEGSTEESAENADTASQAVLLESEKFVSHLAENDNTSETSNNPTTGADTESLRTRSRKPSDASVQGVAPTKKSSDLTIVHKNNPKRSLDETNLDEQELVSPPSSPNSKRARVQ